MSGLENSPVLGQSDCSEKASLPLPRYLPVLRIDDIPGAEASEEELFRFAMSIDGYRAEGSFDACMAARDRVEAYLTVEQLSLASLLDLRLFLFGAARACRHTCIELPRAAFETVLSELKRRTTISGRTDGSNGQLVFDAFTFGLERNERHLATLIPRVAPEHGVVAAAADGALSFDMSVQLEANIGGVPRVDLIVKMVDAEPLACEFKVLWPNGQRECLDKSVGDFTKLARVGGLVVIFAYSVTAAPEGHARRKSPAPLSRAVDAAIARFGEPMFRSGTKNIHEIRETSGEWELLAWQVEKEL